MPAMALGPFAAGALSGWFGYQAVIVASGLILFPLIVLLELWQKEVGKFGGVR